MNHVIHQCCLSHQHYHYQQYHQNQNKDSYKKICGGGNKTSTLSTTRKIKNILKPVLRRLFKKSPTTKNRKYQQYKKNSYVSLSAEDDFDFEWMSTEESTDNEANEELEERLIEEIQNSPDDAAIFIFNENGSKQLQTINREKFYIPVHFARTNAGTFFWTTAQKPIEPLRIEWHFLDRWAQA